LTRGDVEEDFGFRFFFFVVDAFNTSATKDDILDSNFNYAGLG
jgi:hypothetical protein